MLGFITWVRSSKILSKRRFEISDYKSLSTEQIEKTRENLPSVVKKAGSETIFTGKLLKKYLDEIYGEDKYIFVCIGTSPSGIGRFMEFSGVETKYFPITDFRGDVDYARRRLNRYPKETEKYISFLNKNGINPKDIETNDKTILFVDFTSTGETLQNFEMLVRERAELKDSKKIKFIDINEAIAKADSHFDLSKKESNRANDYVLKYMCSASICPYGGIPHLQISEFNKIDKIIKTKTNEEAKLFNFYIIDKLAQKNELKENPLNRNCI